MTNILSAATPVSLTSMSDEQLYELHDRLGDKRMEALIQAEEARTARQEAVARQAPPAKMPPTVEEVMAAREAAATLLESKGGRDRKVAAALRGNLPPFEGGQVLRSFLQEAPKCPFRPVVEAAIAAADAAVVAARKAADEAATEAAEERARRDLQRHARKALAAYSRRW